MITKIEEDLILKIEEDLILKEKDKWLQIFSP